MKESKFVWRSPNGDIRGNFVEATSKADCVLLCCGHNGFYHFGFFKTIQIHLARYGYSSVTFNYSHCGITDDGDIFNDLIAYEKNCRQLEKEDIYFMATSIATNKFYNAPGNIILLAHSMGGISATFAMNDFLNSGKLVAGFALLCSMSTLQVRTQEVMNDWIKNSIYYRENTRTKQQLPQGKAFLDETINAEVDWNMKLGIQSIDLPIFIAHSDNDESVPFLNGEKLFNWAKETNDQTCFHEIKNANHNLNTSHLGDRDSLALQAFCYHFVAWMDDVLK